MKFFNYIKCKNSEEFIFKFVSLVSFFALAIFIVYIIKNYEYIFPFSEGAVGNMSDASETQDKNDELSDIKHVTGPNNVPDDAKYMNIIKNISTALDVNNRETTLDKIDEYRIKNNAIIIDTMLKGLNDPSSQHKHVLDISQRLLIENAYYDGSIDRIINYIPPPTPSEN